MHSGVAAVKRHEDYRAAKGGDIAAADRLAVDLVSQDALERLAAVGDGGPVELLPIHALEYDGVNEIPTAVAKVIARRLNISINSLTVQANSVGHTGAGGYHRLANQARFQGEIVTGGRYLLVDDFVGQGGTLANMIGFVRAQNAAVLAATVLTGQPYSAKLAPDEEQIRALRTQHGQELEDWWYETFGFSFDCLTRSEARYLQNSPDADTIRNRIAAARLTSSP